MNINIKDSIKRKLLYIFLIGLALLFLGPLLWVFFTSFKTMSDIFSPNIRWLPTEWTLENYVRAVSEYPLWIWMRNSIIVTSTVIILSPVIYIMPAYALAVLDFKWKNAIIFILMASIMIPRELSAIFAYKIVAEMKLLDTYTAIVLPQLSEAISVFLMYNFFKSVPNELRESCELDGGGHMTTLWKIYIPLAGPIISVTVILNFVTTWNNFFWPLIVNFTNKSMTLPVGLATIMNSVSESSASRQYGLLMAISILVSIPVLVLFISLQKKLVQAVTSSGIKG